MRLSVQLYTVRDHLSADLPGTLAEIRKTGLEYVELAGMYDRSATEWKDLLDGLGLKINAAHIGLDLLKNNLEGVISDAQTLGFKYVVLPWIGQDAYADGWDKFAESLVPIAQAIKDAGLVMAYHNHAFEFENHGLDKFYASIDADLLKAQLDLAWVKIGGADPVEYVHKMAGRGPLVHLKDFDPAQTPQWRPAGEGVMDFPAILKACEEVGVEFGTIELDESPADPLDAVRTSAAFFRSCGLS